MTSKYRYGIGFAALAAALVMGFTTVSSAAEVVWRQATEQPAYSLARAAVMANSPILSGSCRMARWK